MVLPRPGIQGQFNLPVDTGPLITWVLMLNSELPNIQEEDLANQSNMCRVGAMYR